MLKSGRDLHAVLEGRFETIEVHADVEGRIEIVCVHEGAKIFVALDNWGIVVLLAFEENEENRIG